MLHRHQLPICISLLFLICWLQIQHGLSIELTSVSTDINNLIKRNVVPSYRLAYTTLNVRIVQPLLDADINMDKFDVYIMIRHLLSDARQIHDLLHEATCSSKQISTNIDEMITQLVLLIPQQEKQVRENQLVVDQANNKVQAVQKQVNNALEAVHYSQNSVHSAQHEVQEAQDVLNRENRKCSWGRRRKRLIWLYFMANGLCHAITSPGLDNAKKRQNIAENNLYQARQHLQNYQQNLYIQHALYATASQQLTKVKDQLQGIQAQLKEKQAIQSLMTSVSNQTKMVEVHLNDVLGKSAVLRDEIVQLINFELLIQPLHDIYEKMITNKIMKAFDFEITAETVRQINANLEKLSKKLPKIPINELLTVDSEEVYSGVVSGGSPYGDSDDDDDSSD